MIALTVTCCVACLAAITAEVYCDWRHDRSGEGEWQDLANIARGASVVLFLLAFVAAVGVLLEVNG